MRETTRSESQPEQISYLNMIGTILLPQLSAKEVYVTGPSIKP